MHDVRLAWVSSGECRHDVSPCSRPPRVHAARPSPSTAALARRRLRAPPSGTRAAAAGHPSRFGGAACACTTYATHHTHHTPRTTHHTPHTTHHTPHTVKRSQRGAECTAVWRWAVRAECHAAVCEPRVHRLVALCKLLLLVVPLGMERRRQLTHRLLEPRHLRAQPVLRRRRPLDMRRVCGRLRRLLSLQPLQPLVLQTHLDTRFCSHARARTAHTI